MTIHSASRCLPAVVARVFEIGQVQVIGRGAIRYGATRAFLNGEDNASALEHPTGEESA